MAELRFPRQRAFPDEFITRSREGAKIIRNPHLLRAFAPSRENNRGLSNASAFGG
ncbi:hypothetical protein [Maricaulis salignorans]|uniref:hypothetical protein n=1 Tax=Maricaulis salignorans TaxID=144026 RepID=UPI003A8D5F19